MNSQSLLELIPVADDRGDKWTHFYGQQDRYTRVDMILASPAARSLVVVEESFVFDSPAVRIASDHRPVVWTVDFPNSLPKIDSNGRE